MVGFKALRAEGIVAAVLVFTCMAGAVQASARPFWLDASGRVFDISTYGYLRIDGAGTHWYPETSPLDLIVTRDGDAIYTDSYGRLSRNGVDLRQGFLRPHDFKVDRDGHIYSVKDHAGQVILRDGRSTGYRIKDGSGFAVSRGGRVAYIDRRRETLHIGSRDTGLRFNGRFFDLDDDGGILFVVHRPRSGWRYLLFRLDSETGENRMLSSLARYDSWALDPRGRIWVADAAGRILRDGEDMGYRGYQFQLDGAGRCYTSGQNGQVLRNGRPLGLRARGGFKVSEGGDVFHFPRSNDGELYRNGQRLGIRVAPLSTNAPAVD